MLQEWHHFFDNTRRWRNLRKITSRRSMARFTPRPSC